MTAGKGTNSVLLLYAGVMAVLVVFLAGSANHRNAVWADKISMWRDVVQKSPRSARAHNNLGEAYHQQHQLDKAAEEYLTSVTINPYLAVDAYSNLAAIFVDLGEYDRAVEYFTKLLYLNASDHLVYANRANAYALKGAYAQAVGDYTTAAALAPWDSRFYLRRGTVFLKQRDARSAAADFARACDLGDRDACSRLSQLRTGGAR